MLKSLCYLLRYINLYITTLIQASGIVVSDADCGAVGPGFKSPRCQDVCKRIVSSQHRGTLNCCRTASPLGKLVEEKGEASGHPQGFLPPNWGETKPNCTFTCMVFKATVNDRCKSVPCPEEFYGP
ncbi:uncharacterized protein TNCV_579791 [Trichonephila clavipes]|nr:uncharacterized protein TNCV_579791 [Trichonephila clavipes]